MLVVFGGLPGVGKTTIARALATRRRAVYLRIDEIEHALRLVLGATPIGPAGYTVGQALAASNLANGTEVIADCVNPVPESRQGWRAVAVAANASLLEIEIICSDPIEHRRRVETRRADIPGHTQPTWSDVLNRDYHPWDGEPLQLDTVKISIDDAVTAVERAMSQ